MTAEASPAASTRTSERRPPPRRTRISKRIAVLYNIDYEEGHPDTDPSWAARAEVGQVAATIAKALVEAGCDAQLVPVDGDLAELRARLVDLDVDCAFNLCESLAG